MIGRLTAAILIGSALMVMGSWHVMAMDLSDPDAMGSCVFMMGAEALCTMDVFDHLSHYQSMFMALVPQIVAFSLILTAALTIAFGRWREIEPPQKFTTLSWLYTHWQHNILAADYLRQAFSQGILHPKTY